MACADLKLAGKISTVARGRPSFGRMPPFFCIWGGETRGGTLAGWVLRHTVRTLLGRLVTGETVVGSTQGCQGESPVSAEKMSMSIVALIWWWHAGSCTPSLVLRVGAPSTVGGTATCHHYSWGGSSAAFCPSRPHITVDHMRALLGPDAHHIVKYWVPD